MGMLWFPAVVTLIAIEYFVYDDQFTMIALIVLPMIIAAFHKLIYRSEEDVLLTYIRMSLMSVAIAEVLSTTLLLGGVGVIYVSLGWNVVEFLSTILPHAIIEIPAFLFAAAASIRIARVIGPKVSEEDWSAVPAITKRLLMDERTWRTYMLIVFFLIIAALIESNLTWIISIMIMNG